MEWLLNVHPKTPRLRMFAGPNGSGKSTIKDIIPAHLLGVYLNADDIEKHIRQTHRCDLSFYASNILAQDAIDYFYSSTFLAKAGLQTQIQYIQAQGHILDFSQISINSYFASVLVDFLRRQLLQQKTSFSFETVMSSKDKIEFLKLAQTHGFRTYLYFIATADPDINISRVAYRVKMGGHPVPQDKIVQRYYRSLDYLIEAVTYANRAYIFDNSTDSDSVLLAEITNGIELELKVDTVPTWFKTAILDKFV